MKFISFIYWCYLKTVFYKIKFKIFLRNGRINVLKERNAILEKEIKKEVCHYCNFRSENVEASGILYCPNAMCTGPGGAWFRHKLKSFKEVGDRHTVSEIERNIKGRRYMTWQRILKFFKMKHNL